MTSSEAATRRANRSTTPPLSRLRPPREPAQRLLSPTRIEPAELAKLAVAIYRHNESRRESSSALRAIEAAAPCTLRGDRTTMGTFGEGTPAASQASRRFLRRNGTSWPLHTDARPIRGLGSPYPLDPPPDRLTVVYLRPVSGDIPSLWMTLGLATEATTIDWSSLLPYAKVLGIALVLGVLARWIVVGVLKRASSVSQTWIDTLQEYGVFKWGMILVSLIVLDVVVPKALEDLAFLSYIERFIDAALVFVFAILLSRFLSAYAKIAQRTDTGEKRPVKVFTQALQLVIWCYAILVIVSIITQKDISQLLTGLTTIGAVLVYVFRDYILGWNAAVQIAANDLLRDGDWVTVEGHEADGKVIDIGLLTIKIQNWDKTVSMVPTYDIISSGCRNMRFMYDSGGRRIKRKLALDGQRVRICDQALLDTLFQDPRVERVFNDSGLKSMTNLALFRRWLGDWLSDHDELNNEMTSMVRELNFEGSGVILEIYAFTATTAWEEHERVKADIHDRVVSELARFDLGLFQDPGGADVAALGGADRTAAAAATDH